MANRNITIPGIAANIPRSVHLTLDALKLRSEQRHRIFQVVERAPDPEPNAAIVYALKNTSGKIRLMVQFPTGAAIQLSIEV